MFSFLKKLLGGVSQSPPPSQPPSPEEPPAPKTPVSTGSVAEAGMLLGCEGIDWRGDVQRAFLKEVVAPRRDAMAPLLLDERFGVVGACSKADAAVLAAYVVEREPTRIMEIGSGESTMALRHGLKIKNLPAELIVVDPAPRLDLDALMDAHVDQPIRDLPVDDFLIMQEGEMVLFRTSHIAAPDSDVEHVVAEILPQLPAGVVVGFHGITLPRQYDSQRLSAGHNEQQLLLDFLQNRRRAEIMYAGGYLREYFPTELKGALPADAADSPSELLLFRVL